MRHCRAYEFGAMQWARERTTGSIAANRTLDPLDHPP